MSDWYYAENNEQKGPVNESELKTHSRGEPASGGYARLAGWDGELDARVAGARRLPSGRRPRPRRSNRLPSLSATTVPNPSSVTPVTTPTSSGRPRRWKSIPTTRKRTRFSAFSRISGFFALCRSSLTKNSPFANYHANQGLTLFLAEICDLDRPVGDRQDPLFHSALGCGFVPFVALVWCSSGHWC